MERDSVFPLILGSLIRHSLCPVPTLVSNLLQVFHRERIDRDLRLNPILDLDGPLVLEDLDNAVLILRREVTHVLLDAKECLNDVLTHVKVIRFLPDQWRDLADELALAAKATCARWLLELVG